MTPSACAPGQATDQARTPPELDILALASLIEHDPSVCLAWYHDDPIVHLGNITAQLLVNTGRAAEVMAFLEGVIQQHLREMPH